MYFYNVFTKTIYYFTLTICLLPNYRQQFISSKETVNLYLSRIDKTRFT